MDDPIISLSAPYRNWVFALILICVTLLAYYPAWNGKPIWDDDLRLTTTEFRPISGLGRIWIEPKTTQQYHPLVDTVFWIEDKLWGDSMLGYHFVNILLHAASALLLFKILQKLGVPGAWLAAAIFALHPVQVESVAWLVELKNTLSGVLFFGTLLAYLKFYETRRPIHYALVLLLFLFGLTAKTIVATLPAAIVILIWWKRGKVDLRRDIKPLIPFFVLGIAAGLLTAWMERKFSGAEGSEFNLSMLERIIIAGRAFWFYLAKLFWPSNLVLIYPRWQVDTSDWSQYLFPITAILLIVGAWLLRNRSRSLFAALLYFALIIFPVAGLFNVSYFNFSFVADHFQYLATAGIVALIAATVTIFLNQIPKWPRTFGYGWCLVLLVTLADMTWAQSENYRNAETSFRAVIAKNPNSPIAHNNLGTALRQNGSTDEAIAEFQKAVQLEPDYQFGRYNLGAALVQNGRIDEAIPQLEKVLQLNPNHPKAYYSLATAVAQKGDSDRAILYYERALKLNPEFPDAHGSLGNVLFEKGEIDAAIEHYRQEIHLEPENPTAHYNLAMAFLREQKSDEAIEELQRALRIDPNYPDARQFLDQTLSEKTKSK